MSDTRLTLEEIKEKVDGLLDIPANEQGIGHFQVAVKQIFEGFIRLLERFQV